MIGATKTIMIVLPAGASDRIDRLAAAVGLGPGDFLTRTIVGLLALLAPSAPTELTGVR